MRDQTKVNQGDHTASFFSSKDSYACFVIPVVSYCVTTRSLHMEIWMRFKPTNTNQSNVSLHLEFVKGFPARLRRCLPALFLPCEVAVLISCAQTCFFHSHNISGPVRHQSMPPLQPLTAQIDGAHVLLLETNNSEDSPAVQKGFLKQFLRPTEIIPSPLKNCRSKNSIQVTILASVKGRR